MGIYMVPLKISAILVLVDGRRAAVYILQVMPPPIFSLCSLSGLSLRRENSMHTLIPRRLRRLPSALLQEFLVLELIHLDVQGATDLDHLLFAVASKAPEGEVTAGTSTCEEKYPVS